MPNDQLRKLIIADTNRQLEEASLNALEKIVAEMSRVIESGRRERILGLIDLCKAWEGQLLQVNLTAGKLASKNIVRAEREFRTYAADLEVKITEHCEDDSADYWKND